MSPIPLFWLEDAGMLRRSLRRFEYGGEECPSRRPGGYRGHGAVRAYDEVHAYRDAAGIIRPAAEQPPLAEGAPPAGWEHEPWPETCACGLALDPARFAYQVFLQALYRRADTGAVLALDDAPAGACWDGAWLPGNYRGPDGIALTVRTPGGDWCVDHPASNCTRKDEPHQCWVRHGDPRHPATLHVDKDGDTCAAGAGSILVGGYHGFLHHGALTDA